MMFNIDAYLNIIGKLPLNMRFLLGWQAYTNIQKMLLQTHDGHPILSYKFSIKS